MLGRTCLNATCCEVAWQTTSALSQSQRRNAMIWGCWGQCVGLDVFKCTMLMGLHDIQRQHCWGAKDAIPWYWVAEAHLLGRMCLYAPFWKYKLLRNRLTMCELLNYELILDLCYKLGWNWLYWNWQCWNRAINFVGTMTIVWIVSYVGNIK